MKSTYLIILSSLFLLSCTNFLDEESTGTMSIDSNLSSVESCTALANSTYVNTNVFDANEGRKYDLAFGIHDRKSEF